MSTAATVTMAASRPESIAIYRDDGPLAAVLGRGLGPVLPLSAPMLLLAAAAPLLAVAALGGGDVSLPAAAAVLAWAIGLGSASRERPAREKTRWAEPPLLRTMEFAGLTWIAALEGPSAYPAAFALIAALTLRHYDIAYRLRLRGTTPPPWVNALSGGWDGRLLAALVLLLVGALPAGYYVAAAVLGLAFAAESATGWRQEPRAGRQLEDEDEEGA